MIKNDKLPDDILSRLSDAAKILLADDRVVFAYLFGGIARGEVKPLSDVDIAVYIRGTKDPGEYKMELFNRLTDAMGTSEVDLVVLNTAPISLRGRILQNRRIIADKKPFLRHAYESLTLREFFDFKVKEDSFFKKRYGVG